MYAVMPPLRLFSACWMGAALLLVLLTFGVSVSGSSEGTARVVIDAYPSTAMVEQGSTLVLVCRVVGVPSTTVLSYQWTCPGCSCDAGAVDPEWAARVQQGNILVVNVRNGNDAGSYTCTVIEFEGDSTTQQVGVDVFMLSVAIGLSFLNEDGGLGVFFPNNSFVTNSTLTKTTKSGRPTGGNDHIACYSDDPNAAQVTWHNSSGGPLAVCLRGPNQPVPCEACGPTCDGNGAVGLDPPQHGHTDIHMFTNDSNYVNQDLQCQVNVSDGQSAFIGVYLKDGALQPPSSITQEAITTTTVSVSWSQVSGATGYYVSYQRQDLGTPPVVTPQYERIVGGATSVTLSGLEPGTTYRIRVWSTDGTSVSSEAGEMDVATVESAPTPPRMLTTAGNTTSSSVELNWLPPLHPNGAIRYEIEYEPAMPPGDLVNAGNSSSLYFILTLPNEFLSYTVRVAAVNSQGQTKSSDLLSCQGKNRERGPQPPTNVSVDTVGDESVVVSWDAQQSMRCDVVIGNYSVRYQRRNGCTAGYTSYTTVYTSETQNTLLELEPGTNYRVSVASIASNGEMSAYSDWVSFANVMTAPSQVACPCSLLGVWVGAAGGGFVGGVLLTAAIAGCLACTVFYKIRTNREVTANSVMADVLYENPQLQDNLAYCTSSVHKEGRQEATYYDTCIQ